MSLIPGRHLADYTASTTANASAVAAAVSRSTVRIITTSSAVPKPDDATLSGAGIGLLQMDRARGTVRRSFHGIPEPIEPTCRRD